MNLSPDVSPATTDKIDSSPDSDLSVPAPQPNPSAALDLDEIEADFADPGVVGLRKLGTVGTGPLCRLVAAVPDLVAEVRRLREVKDAALAELDRSLEARDRRAEAECDAARAEAERLRENAITGNEVYRKLIDALGFAWNAPDDEHESAWVDSEDLERQATALRAEAARVREALQAIRDWAEANHGGAARPVEIWPGLKAALDAGLGDPE